MLHEDVGNGERKVPGHVHHIHNNAAVDQRVVEEDKEVTKLESQKEKITAVYYRNAIARQVIFNSRLEEAKQNERQRKQRSFEAEEARRKRWEEEELLIQQEAAMAIENLKNDYDTKEADSLVKLNKKLDEINDKIDKKLGTFPRPTRARVAHHYGDLVEEHVNQVWEASQSVN